MPAPSLALLPSMTVPLTRVQIPSRYRPPARPPAWLSEICPPSISTPSLAVAEMPPAAPVALLPRTTTSVNRIEEAEQKQSAPQAAALLFVQTELVTCWPSTEKS